MRKLSNWVIVCWGAVAMLAFSGASFAEESAVSANVTNGKNIYENGKPDAGVPACATCHGDKAMGMDAMGTPRLANIGYVYIVKQLTNFAEDKRKDLTMDQMNGIAKGLTVQDRRDLAAYENSFPRDSELSDLNALKADGTVVGEAYKGQILVKYGREGKAGACQSCHGSNGRGADPVYPKIGQQKYVYLVNQLTHWRDGSRANDPMGQMQAIARTLSDDDIHNAAAYLSQAPARTEGDTYELDNKTVLKNVTIVK
ncbi:MAG: c-type cytochrome [Gallionella sp.]